MEGEASDEVGEGSKWGGVIEGLRRSSKGTLSYLSSKLPRRVGAKVLDDKTHFTDDKAEAYTHYSDSVWAAET